MIDPLTGLEAPDTPECLDTEVLDEVTEDVDDLTIAVNALETQSEIRQTELLERIDTCRTQLQALTESSATFQTQAESPMLVQIVSQLIQIQAELTSLKLSMDMKPNRQPPSESVEILPDQNDVEDRPEAEIVVDQPIQTPPKKRRFF